MKKRIAKIDRRILVICEGKTEVNYADNLKQNLPKSIKTTINIVLVTDTNFTANRMFNIAKEKASEAKFNGIPFETIWLFFDHDENKDLKQLFRNILDVRNSTSKQKKLDIRYVFTTNSFERWFLLHLDSGLKGYLDAKQELKALNKKWMDSFKNEYQKTDFGHFEQLKDFLPDAIQRAKQIR